MEIVRVYLKHCSIVILLFSLAACSVSPDRYNEFQRSEIWSGDANNETLILIEDAPSTILGGYSLYSSETAFNRTTFYKVDMETKKGIPAPTVIVDIPEDISSHLIPLAPDDGSDRFSGSYYDKDYSTFSVAGIRGQGGEFAVMRWWLPGQNSAICYDEAALVFRAEPGIINFIPDVSSQRRSYEQTSDIPTLKSEHIEARMKEADQLLNGTVLETLPIIPAKLIAVVSFQPKGVLSNITDPHRCNYKNTFDIIETF